MITKVLNSKGEPIVLNAREARLANDLQQRANALGYDIDITTLTAVSKKVLEQRFFKIAPADYMPVRVGEGAWAHDLTTFRSFSMGGDFSTGLLNTGNNQSRMASADAGVDSLSVQLFPWAKSIGWTLFDLNYASRAGNWDIVTAKEKSRKQNWDLGIQKLAFLGMSGVTGIKGLLNQSDVTVDTDLIVDELKDMTAAELNVFVAGIIQEYRANSNYTAMPTHFIIPESDFNGLAAFTDPSFPLRTKLSVLLEAFQTMTQNKQFKILPLVYAQAAQSDSVLSTDRYTLLNYDEDSVRMDIPVDYTNTLANSIDNFNFQNVGYGQFSGAKAYRPLEMLYLDLTPA